MDDLSKAGELVTEELETYVKCKIDEHLLDELEMKLT
jgi:hypothetical protein